MKKQTKLWRLFAAGIVGIGVVGLIGGPASAQVSDSVSGVSAGATVVSPIGLFQEEANDLRFGAIFSPVFGAGSGSITVSATGAVSTINLIRATTPSLVEDTGAAAFVAWGELGASFTINLPSSLNIICIPAAGTACIASDQMGVTLFSSLPSNSGTISINDPIACGPSALSGACEIFLVGATLTVAEVQPTGFYENFFTVTVQYQ